MELNDIDKIFKDQQGAGDEMPNESAWYRLEERLEKEQPASTPVRSLDSNRYLKIAVVGLFFIGSFLLLNRSLNNINPPVSVSQIETTDNKQVENTTATEAKSEVGDLIPKANSKKAAIKKVKKAEQKRTKKSLPPPPAPAIIAEVMEDDAMDLETEEETEMVSSKPAIAKKRMGRRNKIGKPIAETDIIIEYIPIQEDSDNPKVYRQILKPTLSPVPVSDNNYEKLMESSVESNGYESRGAESMEIVEEEAELMLTEEVEEVINMEDVAVRTAPAPMAAQATTIQNSKVKSSQIESIPSNAGTARSRDEQNEFGWIEGQWTNESASSNNLIHGTVTPTGDINAANYLVEAKDTVLIEELLIQDTPEGTNAILKQISHDSKFESYQLRKSFTNKWIFVALNGDRLIVEKKRGHLFYHFEDSAQKKMTQPKKYKKIK